MPHLGVAVGWNELLVPSSAESSLISPPSQQLLRASQYIELRTINENQCPTQSIMWTSRVYRSYFCICLFIECTILHPKHRSRANIL